MPTANVRGATIRYEILGTKGPWMALSPGGRRGLEAVESLAKRMAEAGYRVVLFDRRNCGASDVMLEGTESEYEIWADDLHELLRQLNALPAIVGGSSSGCRTSLLFALRHPEAVRALLLWRVTGGRFAVERLSHNYYTQYIELAKKGGMKAVCEAEHFAERIAARPSNRDRIMAIDPKKFIATMELWKSYFMRSVDLPVIGATEQDLRSIRVPTLVVPGNDRTHSLAIGRNAQRLIPNSELFELYTEDKDVDLVPPEEWDEREDVMARACVDFLQRQLAPARA